MKTIAKATRRPPKSKILKTKHDTMSELKID